MTYHDAIELVKHWKLTTNDNITKQAYAYCKMTVVDEMDDVDYNHTPPISRYMRLEFVEFLEFISRLAHFLYIEENSTLLDKTDRVLSGLLALIGESVKYETTKEDILSESDDELYKW